MGIGSSALSGAGKVASKALTEKGMAYAKKIYFKGKMKQDESVYPASDKISDYSYNKYTFVIEVAFRVHTQVTIEKLLRCIRNHSEFENYLFELGKQYPDNFENEYEEDTYKSLICDCVKETYKNENLTKWASILNEPEKFVIEIDQHNEILTSQRTYHNEEMDVLSAMADNINNLKQNQATIQKTQILVSHEIIDQND